MRRRALVLAAVGSLVGCSSEGTELARLEVLPIDVANMNYPALLAARSDGASTSFPLSDFGFYNPSDATTSVRSTFWAAAGTVVRAPVTGVVREVVALGTGDLALHIHAGADSTWELVHVRAVTVKVGDHVTAGHPVGEVSNGRVELGLVVGGAYECPFAEGYVDVAARRRVFGDLTGARTRIERLLGDANFFDQPAWESENCISLEPVDG